MIKTNEIRNKTKKKYNDYLQDIVKDISFTEIVITGNKEWSDNFSDNDREITQLYNDSKEKKGYGYSIKYQTINKKRGGIQNIPIEFSFKPNLIF